MLVAIIATVGMLFTLTADLRIAEADVTITAPVETECVCGECDDCEWLAALIEETEWIQFENESYDEHLAMFDAMFAAYEVKVSKNGRTMIRTGNTGSFKFVKRG